MSILASPCTFIIILRLYPFLSLPRPPEAVFYNSVRPYILPPFFPCSWHFALHHLSPRLPSVECKSRYLVYPSVSCRAVFYPTFSHCLLPDVHTIHLSSPASLFPHSPLVLSPL
ncbi:hypothetical protein JB92DRAFT_2864073 [Gautieria morchelliformis]|nr:hypothetical protein JB92DRAFT_2864073 [Gautieria morchelliformis]